jgi:osmoprotectant transport system ATP-binding protein
VPDTSASSTEDGLGAPHPTAGTALAARRVTHRYGDVLALDGVTIDVAPGGSLALVGESGSGKTTLLRCFNRMVEPGDGVVEVSGTDVRQQSPIELRRHIGYVPQDGGLLPHWRVLRNVALVPTLLGQPDPEAAAVRTLALVGLPTERFGARFPHELSGGQRQRVAIARALAARPGVILLDEPFGSLDAITRADLQSAFADIRRELAVTTLLVTHDLAEAARLADNIAVMRQGRIEQCAPAATLRDRPATDYIAALFARALAAPDALRSA